MHRQAIIKLMHEFDPYVYKMSSYNNELSKSYREYYSSVMDYIIDNNNYTSNSQFNCIQLQWVSPSEIKFYSRRELPNHYPIYDLAGSIKKGDWDIASNFSLSKSYDRPYYLDLFYDSIVFQNTTFYNSMYERYEKNTAWKNTSFYQNVKQIIENKGVVVWGGKRTSVSDVELKMDYIDHLYTAIDQGGYQSQLEFDQPFTNSLMNEILVDIGRNGDPLLVDGKHRLAIAKLLGLKEIPVRVLVRHKKWVENQPCENQSK